MRFKKPFNGAWKNTTNKKQGNESILIGRGDARQ